jgi:hypothetical protein
VGHYTHYIPHDGRQPERESRCCSDPLRPLHPASATGQTGEAHAVESLQGSSLGHIRSGSVLLGPLYPPRHTTYKHKVHVARLLRLVPASEKTSSWNGAGPGIPEASALPYSART